MKRKLFNILVVGLTLAGMTSCGGDFLDQNPTDALPDSEVATPENAPKVFNGAWRYMFDTYFTLANPGYSAVLRQDDMMGDDVVAYPGKYGFTSSYQFKDTPDKTIYRTRAFWTLHYKTIDNCNTVISIESKTKDNELDKYRGMAYALRAFTYFSLVQHYQFTYRKDKDAKCVPVYTEPTGPNTEPKAKSTVGQVYALILSDLTNAQTLLQGKDRSQKFEPNTNVVNGLFARVYLVMGNYDEAAKAAVAARDGYPLMPVGDYSKGFNDVGNVEWIWGHPQTPEQSNASYAFNYQDVVSPSSYYYSFMADPYFKELFTDSNDIRLGLFEWIRDGYLGYKKFLFKGDKTADVVLMRSAEMYLVQAEALARQDNVSLTDAVAPLNELRSARGVAPYDATGKTRDEVINEILLERRRELWGEGFSLTDILRTEQAVVRRPYNGDPVLCRQIPGGAMKEYTPQGHYINQFPDKTAFVPNSTFYLYAVPETEENANPNLNK